MGETVTRNM